MAGRTGEEPEHAFDATRSIADNMVESLKLHALIDGVARDGKVVPVISRLREYAENGFVPLEKERITKRAKQLSEEFTPKTQKLAAEWLKEHMERPKAVVSACEAFLSMARQLGSVPEGAPMPRFESNNFFELQSLSSDFLVEVNSRGEEDGRDTDVKMSGILIGISVLGAEYDLLWQRDKCAREVERLFTTPEGVRNMLGLGESFTAEEFVARADVMKEPLVHLLNALNSTEHADAMESVCKAVHSVLLVSSDRLSVSEETMASVLSFLSIALEQENHPLHQLAAALKSHEQKQTVMEARRQLGSA